MVLTQRPFPKFSELQVRVDGVGATSRHRGSFATPSIHAGNLGKRRKGMFGPPMGQTAIIFVDDMNMPEVETYGAQPPIELLRQLVDCGGYYDLKEKSWVKIVDTVMACAMGPPGGGRNGTTPRFLRHFHLLCVDSFDDDTLTLIFSATSASLRTPLTRLVSIRRRRGWFNFDF